MAPSITHQLECLAIILLGYLLCQIGNCEAKLNLFLNQREVRRLLGSLHNLYNYYAQFISAPIDNRV